MHSGQLLHNFTPNLGRCHLVLVIHRHPVRQLGLEHSVRLLPSHLEFQIPSSQTQLGNKKTRLRVGSNPVLSPACPRTDPLHHNQQVVRRPAVPAHIFPGFTELDEVQDT